MKKFGQYLWLLCKIVWILSIVGVWFFFVNPIEGTNYGYSEREARKGERVQLYRNFRWKQVERCKKVTGINNYHYNYTWEEPLIKCVFDIKNRAPYADKKYDIVNILRNIGDSYFDTGEAWAGSGYWNSLNNFTVSFHICAIPLYCYLIFIIFYGLYFIFLWLCRLPIEFVIWVKEEVLRIRNLEDISSESKIDKIDTWPSESKIDTWGYIPSSSKEHPKKEK